MNESIRIEEITTAEKLAVIAGLAAGIFPETYRELISAEQIDYMMEMMYSEAVLDAEFSRQYRFALIYCKDTAIGYLSWHDAEEQGEKLVKLEKLYLDFAFHGQGIGHLALNFMLETAKKAGAAAVILNVNKGNLRAQKAYNRAGFTRWRSEENPIGQGYIMDDYVMRCDVTPPRS